MNASPADETQIDFSRTDKTQIHSFPMLPIDKTQIESVDPAEENRSPEDRVGSWLLRERVVHERAQRIKPSLVTGIAEKDGNCLFHGVAQQTIGKDQHMMVRASIVEEVEENRDRYVDFLCDESLDEWAARMKTKGTWGDGIACRACSNVYMAPVIVWRLQNPLQHPTIFLPWNPEFDSQPPIFLELDEKGRGLEHYSPLFSILPERVIKKERTEEENMDEEEATDDADNSMIGQLLKDSKKLIVDGKQAQIKRKADLPEVALPTEGKAADPPNVPTPKKAKAEFSEGTAVVGTVDHPILPGAQCSKCKSVVEFEKVRIVGKKATCFICKVYNSRASQLHKLYGSWPPAKFKQMTADEIADFWAEIKAVRSSKDLKLFVDDIIMTSKADVTGSRDEVEELPLSVWAHRGFDPAIIKANCDERIHPQLGTVYAVKLHRKWDEQLEEHKRQQVVKVGSPTEKVQAAPKLTPLKPTKEEKAEARESVRETKALAAEEARKQKALLVTANKFLPKVVKGSFNVTSLLSSKMGKHLNEKVRKEGENMKKEFAAWEKTLRCAMVGHQVEIDEKLCNKVCADALKWHERSLGLLAASALL